MMRNMSIAYDFATFRRPSQVAKEGGDLEQPQTATTLTAPSEVPTTPIPPEMEVCFQIPISFVHSLETEIEFVLFVFKILN